MNNTNLKFKDILYHILDNGDIGNGWKYVEVVDKKGGFSLPKCLYYKGESMKNLLEYSDYINHLDTGKGFINDFVKDIFRECYPGSTNPICKIKENVMMGGGNSDDDDDDDDDGDEAAASKSGQEPQAAASVAGPTGEGEETAADTVGPAASTTGADTTGGDEKGEDEKGEETAADTTGADTTGGDEKGEETAADTTGADTTGGDEKGEETAADTVILTFRSFCKTRQSITLSQCFNF